MHAVNREFVYIDFDDERFLPAKMVASACSMVASACSTVVPAKMRPQFRQKVPKSLYFYSISEPHGILGRIFRIPPETQHPVQNRPWVPHAGGQDYGSLNKLPQNI